jgi:hypothetical protein
MKSLKKHEILFATGRLLTRNMGLYSVTHPLFDNLVKLRKRRITL